MTKNELPEHIKLGIDHFQIHPAVHAPVDFDDHGFGAKRFSFRTRVVDDSINGGKLVEAHARTIESAWERFESAMSERIIDEAISAAEANHEPHVPSRSTESLWRRLLLRMTRHAQIRFSR